MKPDFTRRMLHHYHEGQRAKELHNISCVAYPQNASYIRVQWTCSTERPANHSVTLKCYGPVVLIDQPIIVLDYSVRLECYGPAVRIDQPIAVCHCRTLPL